MTLKVWSTLKYKTCWLSLSLTFLGFFSKAGAPFLPQDPWTSLQLFLL